MFEFFGSFQLFCTMKIWKFNYNKLLYSWYNVEHPFSKYAKIFEKLKKIRNVSPSENAACVLNDWIKPNADYNLYYTVISWHKSRRSKSISSLYYQFVVSTFCVGRIFCGVIMIQHKHTIKCRTRLFNYKRRKKVYGIRLRIQVIYIIHNQLSFHCVKSVLIRSFSGPYFSAFGLKTTR